MSNERLEPDDPPERPQTIDDVLRPNQRRDLRRFPKLVKQAFQLAYRAAPKQLLAAGALQVAVAISLAVQLLVMRRVLATLTDGAPPNLGVVAPELAVFAALLLLVASAAATQKEQQRLLAEHVTKYTTGEVLDVATSVDLIDFERSAFYDRLERARVNASVRPLQIAQGILGLLGAGAAVIAVGATLLTIEPITAGVILIGGLPAVYLNRVATRALYRYTVEQTPGDRRRAYLFHILSRKEEAQEVRAFDSQAFLRGEHDRIYDDRIQATSRLVRLRTLIGVLSGAVIAAVTVVAIVLLLTFVRSGRMALGDAAVAIGAVVLVASRVRALVVSSGSLYEGALFLAEFTDFIASKPYAEPRDRPSRLPPFESIELDQVSFAYPTRQEPSLRDVSLSISRGEVIALVGENGSGKTTLTKLLAGLYRPTQGALRWDGTDIGGLELSAVREHVAVIFQDFARYFLPAHDNIAVSRPAKANDRAGVVAAARAAGAHDFLSALPDGYNSLLGPAFSGGSDLSLGQWQRLALARAYFRDSPLLILDEPTASLDPRGEFEIFQQVRRLAQGHTVVLVSHRFSNVRIADRIVVMQDGRIAEVGSHDQLLEREGLYAELFELQAEGYRATPHAD